MNLTETKVPGTGGNLTVLGLVGVAVGIILFEIVARRVALISKITG